MSTGWQVKAGTVYITYGLHMWMIGKNCVISREHMPYPYALEVNIMKENAIPIYKFAYFVLWYGAPTLQ